MRQRKDPHAVTLPAVERAEVIRFARSLEGEGTLSVAVLTTL